MLSIRFFLIAIMGLLQFSSAALFHLRASLPGNALDGQVINAASEAFFLGLSEPASYCPAQVRDCPNSTVSGTIFAGLTALWVCLHCPSMSEDNWSSSYPRSFAPI